MFAQVEIGNNTEKTAYKDVAITFPSPMGEIPKEVPSKVMVLATVEIEGLDTYGDRYTVNVGNITKEGFTARVARIDGEEGWGMNLKLNYMATYTTVSAKG